MNSYDKLIQKIDRFTRKYYLNKLLSGAIYFVGILVLFSLLILFLEHLGRFNTVIRGVLFYSFIILNLGVLAKYVIIPLLKMYHLGEVISHEQAAQMIGKHFKDVEDKLVNTLELQQASQQSGISNELVLASIEQRTNKLSPIGFEKAIDLSQNKKVAWFALIPVLAFLAVFLSSPGLIQESTARIVDYDSAFVEKPPFDFIIPQTTIEVVKNEHAICEVMLEGDVLPKECFVLLKGKKYRMDKSQDGTYKYVFRNVVRDTELTYLAGGFNSKEVEIKVKAKPIFKQMEIIPEYPKYLSLENQPIRDISEITIPEGTVLNWKVIMDETSQLLFKFEDTVFVAKQTTESKFESKNKPKGNAVFRIIALNEISQSADSMDVSVLVIKDAYPKISVESELDTVMENHLFFKGVISDDYGFNKLVFNAKLPGGKTLVDDISVSNNVQKQTFNHSIELSKLSLSYDESIEYYFEVWDNDGVNGAKSTKSGILTYKVPSKKDLQKKTNAKSDEIGSDLEASLKKAKDLQKELDDLSKKLLEKKNVTWEDKKLLEEILNKQQQLRNEFENTRQKNELNNQKRNKFSQEKQELFKKQEQLEELMEKVMDEDMKKLMDEVQKMLEKMNKEQMQNKVEELELSNKDLEKELDRSLELFKQLEFEKKLEETISDIEDLKKKQNELSNKTDDKSKESDELKKEQEELQKDLEDLKKKLDDLRKKNEDLENKKDVPKIEENEKKAEEEMKKSSDELSKGNKKESKKSQQNASEQLQKMEDKMKGLQQEMESEQQAEDIEALRRLRQNLMTLSFEQEDLLNEVSKTQPNDPTFVELTRREKKLRDDSKMIEDSLFALSKRNAEISSMVNKEISAINQNLDKSVKFMAERNVLESVSRQQFVMTAYNNLALMLDESIQKSQQQKSQKKFGDKSCSKPGSGKPNMSQMKQKQKQLSDQLKKLQEQMEGGKKAGQKPGQKPGRGSQMSEQLAKMAAEQSAIRNELRKLSDAMQGNGKGPEGLKKLQDLMEKNEEDLVNMRINQETLKRQEDIMTKLLESEKSEREREQDNKRESNEGENRSRQNEIFMEYLLEKERQTELLETIPLNLKPFYRNKVNEYYNNL